MNHEQIRLHHLVDDYERLRTRSLRNIKAQRVLLVDARVALKDDTIPEDRGIEIADEFIERVLEAMEAELKLLRNARKPR